ncbi:MAG: hypothetical protein ACOC38_08140 [Promethearchaeia archaeon]
MAKRLHEIYKDLGIQSKRILIEDPTRREKCTKAVTPDMRDYHLDYTGGTKVMACAVRSKWMQLGGETSRCTYLDDKAEVLRFDNGETLPINLLVTLETKAKLHGFKLMRRRLRYPTGPKPSDGAVVAQQALKDGFDSYKVKLSEIASRVPVDSQENSPLKPSNFGLSLSQSKIHPKMRSRVLSLWKDFFKGKWHEYWIAHLIEQIETDESIKVHAGVSIETSGGGSFELDVIALRRHKTYVISCTTSSNPTKAKMKLFEVYMRSRQMGGTLARSAIVAGIGRVRGSDGRIHDRVDYLEELVQRSWDAPNPPRVFGLRHMKEWAGIDISEPNLSTLKRWLKE